MAAPNPRNPAGDIELARTVSERVNQQSQNIPDVLRSSLRGRAAIDARILRRLGIQPPDRPATGGGAAPNQVGVVPPNIDPSTVSGQQFLRSLRSNLPDALGDSLIGRDAFDNALATGIDGGGFTGLSPGNFEGGSFDRGFAGRQPLRPPGLDALAGELHTVPIPDQPIATGNPVTNARLQQNRKRPIRPREGLSNRLTAPPTVTPLIDAVSLQRDN